MPKNDAIALLGTLTAAATAGEAASPIMCG